mmetsp:Transcript_9339/g.22099  ORF Transcript_9339/g.22099 Transcript_9339/m.22099 type:complete len:219 (-) Transcript_9339:1066-1722(-)
MKARVRRRSDTEGRLAARFWSAVRQLARLPRHSIGSSGCVASPEWSAPERRVRAVARLHGRDERATAVDFGFVDERETGESEVSAEAIVVAETRREGVPLEQRDSVGGQQFKRCPTFLEGYSQCDDDRVVQERRELVYQRLARVRDGHCCQLNLASLIARVALTNRAGINLGSRNEWGWCVLESVRDVGDRGEVCDVRDVDVGYVRHGGVERRIAAGV